MANSNTLLIGNQDKQICPLCYGEIRPYFAAAKSRSHYVTVNKCELCDTEFEEWHYTYTPKTCPGHIWGFSHRVFNDNPYEHTIDMVFKCDNCGAKRTVSQDTKRAGFSGRVEIEDPRVAYTLLPNVSWALHFLDKDVDKEAWAGVDKNFTLGEPF
jgi:hypothetical protein